MKIMSILAIVLSLIGSANLATAQTTRDQGVVTGSDANNAAHRNGGVYTDSDGEW